MNPFREKLIAVVGTGVEGISSARFLKSVGGLVTLLDQKTERELDPEIVLQAKALEIPIIWKEDFLKEINRFEIIVRTPGIRPDVPEFLAAKEKGVQVTSNTKIFFDLCPCPIIGVTGTKGKGTTSTLIYQILKRAGKNAFLGGNIGTPALDLLNNLTQNDIVVLELSSFQLFDLEKSPHIAAILMVTCEHLDWHKDSEEYKNAKFNIMKYQNPGNFAVINVDYPVSKEFLNLGQAKKIQVSTKDELNSGVFLANEGIYRRIGVAAERVMPVADVGLIGKHNLENVVAAVGVATALNINVMQISQAIKEFKGLEHRLEFVREVSGVKYYNDSFSTTPETAIAALKSFTEPEILILGGSDKGSDYSELGKEIVNSPNIKAIILIGQMGPKIKESIKKAGEFKGEFKEGAKDMAEIISLAKEIAKEGDVVLLSPACASFGMFKNYKQRGLSFKEAVNKL